MTSFFLFFFYSGCCYCRCHHCPLGQTTSLTQGWCTYLLTTKEVKESDSSGKMKSMWTITKPEGILKLCALPLSFIRGDRSFLWPSFLLILDRVWDEPKQMTSHIFKPCPVSHRTPCRVEGASRSQTHSQPHYRLHAVGTAWMCSWGRTGQAEKEPRKVEVAGGGVPDSVSQSALWIWNVQLDLPKTKVENLPTNSRGLKPYKIDLSHIKRFSFWGSPIYQILIFTYYALVSSLRIFSLDLDSKIFSYVFS